VAPSADSNGAFFKVQNAAGTTDLLSVDASTATLSVQNLAVAGTLNVTGAVTLDSTLTVAGNATFSGDITFSANTRGKNETVASTSTSLAITGKTYTDASYAVLCTPDWDTTCYVTGKTSSGFTLNFGTAAPAAQTVDWIVIR